MAKIKAQDLRGKKDEELLKKLEDLKVELSQLRVAKETGCEASKLSKILVCESIASVLTVINQTQKESLRKSVRARSLWCAPQENTSHAPSLKRTWRPRSRCGKSGCFHSGNMRSRPEHPGINKTSKLQKKKKKSAIMSASYVNVL